MYRSTRPIIAHRAARQLPAFWSTRPIPAFVGPVLVAVAVLGFLAGHQRSSPAVEAPARVAYEAGIALEYPSTWRRTAAAPSIPGLTVSSPLLLSPAGDARRAGLLSGELRAGEAAPLPAGMVSLLHGLPRTEIVDFLDVQAYRYSRVRLAGYEGSLELYVIPNPAGSATALACYATPQHASELAQCQQIVARLTPTGRSRYDLEPDAAYSKRLGAVVAALDGERLVLRRQMGLKETPAAVSRLARTLSARMATAAAAIRTLPRPSAAAAAQAALASSLDGARDAYAALAAATTGAPAVLADAEHQVGRAEAAIDQSLETYALLGYKHP